MGKNSELHIKIQDELFNISHQVEEGELSHIDGLIRMRENKYQLERSLEIIKDFEDRNIDNIPEGEHQGYVIKRVDGRKMYSYKNIPEISEKENEIKQVQSKYKHAFEGFQKGVTLTETIDGVLHWVDSDGVLKPFPELSYGKSYLNITKI